MNKLLLVLLMLNSAILAIQTLSAFAPKNVFREKIRQAFYSGQLSIKDYPTDSHSIARDFYAECHAFHMVSWSPPGKLKEILTPAYGLRSNQSVCQTAKSLSQGESHEIRAWRKHRYWNGIKPVTQFGLSFFSIQAVQLILVCLSFASLFFCAIMAKHCGDLRYFLMLLPILAAASLLSATSTFGVQLTYASGFIFTFVWIGLPPWVYKKTQSQQNMLCYGAVLGTFIWYFDVMHNISMSAALLFFASYAYTLSLRKSFVTLSGWATGLATTIAVKQVLAIFVFGWQATIHQFTSALRYRTGLDSEWPLSAVKALWRIVIHVDVGTFNVGWLAWSLGVLSLFAWGLSFTKQKVSKDHIACLLTATILIAWFILFNHHTRNHARFVARFVFLFFALAALPLWMQILRKATTLGKT